MTLLLFGYVAWHAVTMPTNAPPEVSIEGIQTLADGCVLITVELYNLGSTGLESVTVSVDCNSQPVTFQHVPTDAQLSGAGVTLIDETAQSIYAFAVGYVLFMSVLGTTLMQYSEKVESAVVPRLERQDAEPLSSD